MRLKDIFHWSCQYIQNYNLFIPDDDYDEETDENERSETTLIRQKYTTWVYVALLLVCVCVLIQTALMQLQSRTITISPVTPLIFEQLYIKHEKTLSCPCLKVTVPYRDFVLKKTRFHDVCSSQFISDEWIEAVYTKDESRYGTTDFRTTANSQFYLLARLCSFSKDTVRQNQLNFDNNEFVTIKVLSSHQVEVETNAIFTSMKKSISIQMMSFFNYLRTTSQANSQVSALNTNVVVFIGDFNSSYAAFTLPTTYGSNIVYNDSSVEVEICLRSNLVATVGFFGNINYSHVSSHRTWSITDPDTEIVDGFYGACTSLEALLSSTLDCLYSSECLQLLSRYFPALHQMHLNWSDLVLPSKQSNTSVYDHLLDLFTNEWSIQVNYSKYFHQCSPASCTYMTQDMINYSYAITLFISLYGGLIIILRLIALFIVHLFWSHCPANTNIQHKSFFNVVLQLEESMKRLNLYRKTDDRSEDSIRQQKIYTRVYLFLLASSFVVLLLFTSLNTETITKIERKPSLFTYQKLQMSHSKSIDCPCSNTTISYSTFISFSPTLHQICSSEFVHKRWLSIMDPLSSLHISMDWRSTAHYFFQLISDLCLLANKTSNDAIDRFLLEFFVTSNVLNEIDFEIQLNATVNQLYQSTIAYFGLLVKAVHLFIQIDLPFVKLEQDYMNYFDQNLIVDIEIDEIFQNQLAQIKFRLIGTRDIHSMRINCICAVNPSCESSSVIYNDTLNFNDGNTHSIRYIIPGLVTGCSRMDSLLRSTLQCFYTDSNCTSIIIANLVTFDGWYHDLDSWSEKYALLYDPKRSRFPPNTSIETIVRKLMIEEWNHSFLYEKFYESCAPIHCTYKEKIRAKTTINIITTLLSMIGGLTVSLYVITPYVVKVVSRLLRLIHRRERHSEQQEQGNYISNLVKRRDNTIRNKSSIQRVILRPAAQTETINMNEIRPRWFDRLKMVLWDMISFLYNNVIDLNLFRRRDFGSNVHRTTTMHLGQWATRLYILLFLISLVVISIYNAVQPRSITKTFPKPTVTLYKQLREKYKDKLECSCGSIATTYDRFIEIKAVFHEICRSPFTSNEWRINLTHNLDPSLAIYARRDYRRFLSAHLQYLSGLCDLSIELVTSSMDQFRRSLFITTQLLSEEDFRATINLTIEQRKSVAPMTFARVFFLIRSANHGNAFVSTYETNFRYILPWEDIYGTYAPTEAMIYDNECSCGKHPNCTTEARFLDTKTNMSVSIKGLKIGCTPSESFHLSTLECFYEQSCIDLIQKHVDHIVDNSSAKSAYILSERMIHFLVNSTINELIDDLFVDEWMIQVNYSYYYEECSPVECTYTYMSGTTLLYILVFVLGVQGGLTIVLKWICPKIILILVGLYEYRQRRINIVNPALNIYIRNY